MTFPSDVTYTPLNQKNKMAKDIKTLLEYLSSKIQDCEVSSNDGEYDNRYDIELAQGIVGQLREATDSISVYVAEIEKAANELKDLIR